MSNLTKDDLLVWAEDCSRTGPNRIEWSNAVVASIIRALQWYRAREAKMPTRKALVQEMREHWRDNQAGSVFDTVETVLARHGIGR